jgi:RNA polymerase sigma-70 factor (ECF subfamily)
LDAAATAELEARLEAMVREARTAWPGVDVAPEDFAARLGEVVSEGDLALEAVHAGDLWLALGCLARDSKAIAAFEREIMAHVKPAVERVSGKGISADDMMQATREKLLVAADGTPPKLVQYTGKGPLRGWVRVVAVREALYAQRNKRHDAPDDVALLLQPGKDGIELEILRARHADACRQAVHDALRRLTSEQRALLRYHTRDGLTIDQLAPMLGVHRATAARRLEKAREDALAHTRAILRERSGLSESEARSLCVALAKEVDVSIGRALAETGR